ncbi:MAG: diguanylate cyclase, partial [Chromatiales bacterium]
MKLQTKVFGLTAIIFLGHFSFEQYQGHQQVRADVIDDIRREARIVRGMLMSVREVYQKVFLEHDVPINETTLNFLPAHSLSRISANFQKWVDSGLQFNNVSDQPRNPANAADEIEIKAIEFFRNNPGQVERLTPYTNKNGEAFYHFAQPIWITEHCLQCHGSAEEAPASIKAQYSNAFGYQLGELRGLMSIKLPAKAIDQRVSEHFYHNAISHAASFIAAFMLLWWLFQQSILNRITSLKNALLEFSGGAKDIVIDTGGDDELADVASAFDDMVARINDREQLLRINKSLFSAISETNKAIVRMTSPEQLYKNICHIAVDFAGMDSAMVTMMSADGKQLNPVASAGKLANQLLRMQFSLLADEYRNEGTVAIAAREKRTVVANDVTVLQDKINWYNEIAQLNIAAVASFPCFIEGDVVGVFTVLKSTSGFFDAEAVVLFEEMTSEIGFGIGSFQRDQQRQEMHEQLLSTSEQNKKVQNQLRLLLESTGEGIFGADTTGACTFINQAALDMLGLTQEEVIGRRMHELTHHSHADGTRYDAEDCPIYKAFLTGAPIEIADEFFWHKDGRAFPVEYSAYPIREYGVISGVVTVFRDISERYELNKKMDFLSTHDTLTGLYNRTTFKQRLSMAFEEAALGGYQSVLCYLDIDRFMIINDSYGYLAGDATLQLFSGLILSQIRKTDILSRLTADEFGLYLHDCSLAQAEALCRKICKAVEDFEFTWLNKKLPITVSIGITQLTHENHSVDNVLNAAHSACYVAKEKGRNQIYVQNGNGDEV